MNLSKVELGSVYYNMCARRDYASIVIVNAGNKDKEMGYFAAKHTLEDQLIQRTSIRLKQAIHYAYYPWSQPWSTPW